VNENYYNSFLEFCKPQNVEACKILSDFAETVIISVTATIISAYIVRTTFLWAKGPRSIRINPVSNPISVEDAGKSIRNFVQIHKFIR